MNDGTVSGAISERKELPDYVGKGSLLEKLSENQYFALEKKYLLRDNDGNITETPPEAVYRMARTMGEIEGRDYGKSSEEVDKFTKEFYWIIADRYFSPAGRIWTNAGTDVKGLFNCYVLPIEDTIDLIEGGIFMQVSKAAVIHKNGGGTGYNFSEIRPRGYYVKTSKGIASGPVSFIGQFNEETKIINSGNRRGANMGILDIDHPDILDFIYAKSKRGELKNFNVSVGATEDFMNAVKNQDHYSLRFKGGPFTKEKLENIIMNIEENKVGGSEVGEKPRPASLRFEEGEIVNGRTKIYDTLSREVAGKVDEKGNIQLYAPYIFDKIAELAWETADPGMIFLDEVNRNNPLPNVGPIKATNPCGEQPLHPYDACNLGSVILSSFITENDKGERVTDYNKLEKTVRIATRFMDNVNDASEGPIPQVKETTMANRRIGMGVMGWAGMLMKLGIPYDSQEGRNLAREVMGFITDKAKESSVELAKEKGVFPAFEGSIYDNGKPEDRVRNVDRTTIAPTGTIAMVYDVESGMEPAYAISWRKNIRGGDTLHYTLPSFVEECERRGINWKKLEHLIEKNHGSIQGINEIPEDMQRVFKISHDLKYEDHVLMQAAFQVAIDNAVSKTINMPNSATVEDVRNAYLMAWEKKLKGITVYRDGSKEVQVLETGHGKNLEEISMENPMKVPRLKTQLGINQITPFGNLHLSVTVNPKDNYAPIEAFATLGNAGDEEAAAMEAYGRLTSLWLRSGGSLDSIIAQLKSIGSGAGVATRDGGVHSLPQGVARALMKFRLMRENYDIGEILTGKLEYEEVLAEVSDILRTGKFDGNYESKRLPEEIEGEEIGGGNGKFSFSNKCPACGGKLRYEEGCDKCVCGYSSC